MKIYVFVTSLGLITTGVQADQMLNVDGEDYLLSELTENCQNITDSPAAQIACFSALSKLLDEQSANVEIDDVAVQEKLAELQALASYQDDDSGLLVTGAGCTINTVYFGNYFHVSRRNISEIDLFSAQFDVSQIQLDKTIQTQGGQIPLSKGVMNTGTSALVQGGAALSSAKDGFEPRSPAASLDGYASEILAELPATGAETFDFVLTHPRRSAASAEIWRAFEAYVGICKG